MSGGSDRGAELESAAKSVAEPGGENIRANHHNVFAALSNAGPRLAGDPAVNVQREADYVVNKLCL